MPSFFSHVADASRTILSKLPAPIDPQPISYVEGELAHTIEALRMEFARAVPFPTPAPIRSATTPVGLNTVGMLLDRLSILSVKAWTLEVKRRATTDAERLRKEQIFEIVTALDSARPGFSSLNTKTTGKGTTVIFSDFPTAYVGLLTTNLQLWEAQEVLYLRDIASVNCNEIRGYVDFFSRGNIRRNAFIEAVDDMYWTARGVLRAGGVQ